MRYPRPRSPDEDDTASPAKKISAGGHNKNEDFSTATPEDSNQSEDQGHLAMERRLRTGLMALQGVLATYEAGEPLPRGLVGGGGILASTPRGSGRDGDESLPSQGLETGRGALEANSAGKASYHSRRKTTSPPGGPEALTVVTDTIPPIITGNPENEGPNRPTEARNSGWSGHGEIPGSLSKQGDGCTVACCQTDENTSRHSEASDLADGEKDAPHPPVASIRGEDAERIENEEREHLQHSQVLCEREGSLVRAVDLEAGAQEARRLASLASTTCRDMDEKEASLLR